ncbi:MAG: helix-turn-helix domain-containing protein [Acidobacteria bacterium]|nr:helix-turn-helix domain-containing protein [Acidobacteriota bacterium]MCI0623554.1 helix-turn-helix domain-containing protein [Acidobacteriota bacterium]MCI0719106.1 helix-turn-helix domain-containing protein [Acidobacteriota bacterium]
MTVKNTLSHLRNRQGLSAKRLAEWVGVQRQTIYAMEAGTYVPNTLIALRLAQVLGVKVEDLFSLEGSVPAVSATREVDLLPLEGHLQPGQPLQLCRVQRRVVGVPSMPVPAYLPAADAVLVKRKAAKVLIQPFVIDQEYGRRLLIAGCDPGISVLGRHLKNAGIELVTASCSSSKALDLLKQKQIHVAGSHLRDEATGESNLPAVRKLFPTRSVTVVNFAVWEEGIVVAQGNRKQIRKVEDLARKNLRLINREAGAGSRLLLDATLRRLGRKSSEINGYDQIAYGHIPAAWHVHSGQADYCIATRAAARVFGLDFLPLVSERFDLVIPKQHAELAAAQILLETLNRAAFQRELELLGGYDTTQTGKLLA